MILYWLTPLLGVLAGWLLFRHARTLPRGVAAADVSSLSVIIPARNEEANLPTLLASLRASNVQPAQILVVDDHSTDRTSEIARSYGATVLSAQPLPPGWTGKTWACAQGATAVSGTLLLFLDADTGLAPEGLARILALHAAAPQPTALSLLPYHRTERPYEQLSLFFHLIMAAGAGGFSGLVPQELFGQSLLIDRSLYLAAGGHDGVRQHVLENLHMAAHIRTVGGHTLAATGRGVLSMRMFPEGPAQLVEGWQKGFAAGAAHTPRITVWLISLWLATAVLAALNPLLALLPMPGARHMAFAITLVVYSLFALQLFTLAARLGRFRWWAAAAFPLFLLFYLAVFARSVRLRRRGHGATWKGRQL